MKVLIAGELPFVEQVRQYCLNGKHDTTSYVIEDFLSAVEGGMIMDEASDADVIIDLLNESADSKEELLFGLGLIIPDDALLLVSALPTSATEAASWVPNPERVVGFAILPPVQVSDLVELAAALQTSEENMKRAADFWQGLGCETVTVADGVGLVRARIVCSLINEAISALMEGVASAEDIDKAMMLGTSYPRGPLAWADEIGLDSVLGVMTGLQREWGEDRYRPAPLLRRMVQAGRLGKKTGQGFYRYETGEE